MAKKFNQKLLNEELKKFRLLSEYSFYTEEPKKDDDLILGSNLEEADEEPQDDSKTAEKAAGTEDTGADASADAPADDAPADDAGGNDTTFGTDDTGGEDTTGDDTTGTDTAADTSADTTDAGDTGEEEVDVDVTQLVKGSEEAKNAASDASQKTSELLAKFSELEQRVSAMDSITSKINDLEKEIVKRNPTPVEKLEMRSMSSFPYNIKLTDYWKDVDGYDATGEEKPQEYVLTKDEVDSGAMSGDIKKTFDVPEDYEEEDIQA
jgi:hypothetical protein